MAHGQAAIRFDDAISGMLVYGNVFIRSANGNFGAIQMNSGRDNIMDNNLFIDCSRGVSGGWNPNNSVWRRSRQPTTRRTGYYTTPVPAALPEDRHHDGRARASTTSGAMSSTAAAPSPPETAPTWT
jgi:hypothetical protein